MALCFTTVIVVVGIYNIAISAGLLYYFVKYVR